MEGMLGFYENLKDMYDKNEIFSFTGWFCLIFDCSSVLYDAIAFNDESKIKIGEFWNWYHRIFLTPFESKPPIKTDPFFDSLKVYFRDGWLIICFLKLFKIFVPLSFFYLSFAIIDSKSFFLRYWLTFSLNDILLSNCSPSCPVLIPTLRSNITFEEIKHSRILPVSTPFDF